MKKLSLCIILYFICYYPSFAQFTANEDVIKCDTTNTTLSVSMSDNIIQGGNYTIDDIPILLDDMVGLNTLNNLTDDVFSDVIDIGFDFDFYCNTYNQLLISTNNYLTFDLTDALNYSPWFTYEIPNNIGAFFTVLNAILGPWLDLNPNNGGIIKYGVFGTAPYRRFVVSFENFGYFSCSNLEFNGQIKLFETTNQIEVHIQDQPICNNWNNGLSVLGLVNEDESDYLIYPGWNNTQMTAINQGFRFSPSTITWSTNAGVVGTGDSIMVNPILTTTYFVSMSSCNAIYRDTVTVFVSTPIILQPTIDDILCPGDSLANINLNLSGGTAPLTYFWSSQTNNYNSNSEDAIGIGPGIYSVNITDSLGCETQSPDFTISEIPDSFILDYRIYNASCYGFDDGKLVVKVTGGTPNYNYNWSSDHSFLGNGTDSIYELEKGQYKLVLTDFNGCSDSISVLVNENNPILIEKFASDYNGYNISCFEGNDGWLTFSAESGEEPYSYELIKISNSEIISSNFTIENLESDSYRIVVTDSEGCSSNLEFTLNQPPKLEIELVNIQHESCTYNNDGFMEIKVTGGVADSINPEVDYSYQWLKNNLSYSKLKDIYELEAANYTVLVSDKNKCKSKLEIEITEPKEVKANYRILNDTVTVNYPFVNLYDNSEGDIIEWYWELSNGFTSIEKNIYDLELSYDLDSSGVIYYDLKLVVIDQNFCTDSISGKLAVKDEHTLYVPNGFTPDGDGKNDLFKVVHHGILKGSYKMNIYDRFSSLIFHSSDPDLGWDGKNMFTKNDVMIGAYTYEIMYQDFERRIYDKNNCVSCIGTVTLTR
ncbi:MAG: gliding motility-associated C-terminal domain-containing protein [Flavobacteriales bacterium]